MKDPIRGNTEIEGQAANGYVPTVIPACGGAILNLAMYNFGVADSFGVYETVGTMLAITLLTCLINLYIIVRMSPEFVLSPFVWFLLACAVTCGFGPVIYLVGNNTTLDSLDAFYLVSPNNLLRACVLNCVSILSVCLAFRLSLAAWRKPSFIVVPKPLTQKQLKKLAFVYLGIGFPIKYLFSLPYQLGLIYYVLPGSILNCGDFTSLGLFVLTYLSCTGGLGRGMRVATGMFAGSELVVAVLIYSKMSIIVTLFMIMLGIYVARPRAIYAIVFGFVLTYAYVLASPYVLWCRIQIGRAENISLSGRLGLARLYVQERGWDTPDSEEDQGAWSRLCLVNSQSFAMDAYDAGLPGDTFALALYVLVPRVLWPDKPIMTLGARFNRAVTGNENNATTPGFFGEAYWNGGWPLVIVACSYVGLVYAVITSYVVQAIAVRDFRAIPIAFFGLLMGLRIEDWFVSGYVQTIPIIVVYTLVIYRVHLD